MLTDNYREVDPIQERLKEVVKLLEPEIPEVSRKTGLSYNTVYQLLSKELKKSMQADTLAAFVKAYPKINANYLLTGEGEQLLPGPQPDTSQLKSALKRIRKETGILGEEAD